MKHIIRFLKGIVIGAAMVVPGVSGGTMAIILGIYDDILHSISSVLKEFKKSVIFLSITGLGGVAGLFVFSKIMEAVKSFFELPMIFLFMGIILGGIPVLFSKATAFNEMIVKTAKENKDGKEALIDTDESVNSNEKADGETVKISAIAANEKISKNSVAEKEIKEQKVKEQSTSDVKRQGETQVKKDTKSKSKSFFTKAICGNRFNICLADIVFFLAGAMVILLLGRDTEIAAKAVEASGFKSVIFLFVGGVILAAALVLPGLSGSFMLLIFGVYDITINAINTLNIAFLIPLAVGVIVGTLASTYLIEKLLNKFPRPGYMVILGFVAGSLFTIFPGLPIGLEWISCILTFVIGAAAMLLLTRIEIKKIAAVNLKQ